jgi:hypothetical protein
MENINKFIDKTQEITLLIDPIHKIQNQLYIFLKKSEVKIHNKEFCFTNESKSKN